MESSPSPALTPCLVRAGYRTALVDSMHISLSILSLALVASEVVGANARTNHKTSRVRGKAFDRFVTIYLENTDYDIAAGDRK